LARLWSPLDADYPLKRSFQTRSRFSDFSSLLCISFSGYNLANTVFPTPRQLP
jgi:hypothetical protein